MKNIYFSSASQLAAAVLITLIASSLVACAGASVKEEGHHMGGGRLPQPPVVLVYDFAVNADDVVVDSFGPNFVRDKPKRSARLKEGKAVAHMLSEQIVTQLAKRGIPAEPATPSTPVPMHAALVKGQFVSIEEGDATKRVVIGFGAGSGELRAQVQVYQRTKTGLRRIDRVGGEAHGRKTPGVAGPAAGAAAAGMVVGVVVSAGMNLKSEAVDGAMATNVENLAEQFAERAKKFYKRHGWM